MTRGNWWLACCAGLLVGNVAQASDKLERSKADSVERRIQEKLATPVSFNFKDAPLHQVIEDVYRLTGVNVVPDKFALDDAGIKLDTPLSLRVAGVSLKSALNILLKQAHLTYVIKDEALVITTPASAHGQFKRVVYSVGDLTTPLGTGLPPIVTNLSRQMDAFEESESPLGRGVMPCPPRSCPSDKKPADSAAYDAMLIRLITASIAPDSWSDMGGKGTLQYCPQQMTLVVNQTQDVQEQVEDLLAALRRVQETEYQELSLVIKEVTVLADGKNKVRRWPHVPVRLHQTATVSQTTGITIKTAQTGSIQAVRDPVGYADSEGACLVCYGEQRDRRSQGGGPLAPFAQVGTVLQVKPTRVPVSKLRLDLAVQQSQVEEEGPDGVTVAGTMHRFVRTVEPGSPVRLILQKDDTGEPQHWLELTVHEVRD